MNRSASTSTVIALVAIAIWTAGDPNPARGQQIFAPAADGTLADGGVFGPFDGVADAADWSFNESGYEGAITLARTPLPAVEYRVVWEFNLASASATVPMSASLTFTIRGAARFPAEAAEVHVYAYPADLSETLSDFSSGPTTLATSVSVEPFQPATKVVVNVNETVNGVMGSGVRKIGFRFQINPSVVGDSQQAFIDSLDTDPATKPFVTVYDRVPSDFDGDRDIDLVDLAGMVNCAKGPGVGVNVGCLALDADYDGDVDLRDAASFQNDASRYAR